MRLLALAFLFAAVFKPLSARAEVSSAAPSAFLISAEANVDATPEQAWRALGRIERWWNGSHTYSSDARNLSLDLRAGGCWCERWGRNAVEHGRVVLVVERENVRTLRVSAALGPLQEMGVSGVLTFTVAPQASGARITMTYRVAGDAQLGLDQIAPIVDTVLMEQFGRLNRLSTSGSPD